jgi:RHS repeat-associated protein
MTYPNGQSTVYNYFGNTGNERLQEIKNLTPTSTVLSQDDYTYNAMGTIATWQQPTGTNTPLLWTEGYDGADQLTSAVQTNTAMTSPAVLSDGYGYDPAGNPTTQTIGTVSRTGISYNSVNQLTSSTATGSQAVRFTGALNEAATVTVNGSAATVTGSNFSGAATLSPGTTNTVSVVAMDALGNSRTNCYQTIVPAQPNYSPTYDGDGNETGDGAGRTFTWDAKNELASIGYTGGNATAFAYDALGRRIGIVETGTAPSTKQFVWDGSTMAEERSSSNTVTKRFFAQGEQISGTSYYYTRDHLGSVREMTDASGNIQARYDYEPFGRASLLQGTMTSDFQYAGYYEHAPSSLNLTLYRAYDPVTTRWLSRDPYKDRYGNDAEIVLGPNLYGYVKNNPVDFYDPQGLYGGGIIGSASGGGGVGTGVGGQASAGAGVFTDGSGNTTAGGFVSGGAAAGLLNNSVGTPSTDQNVGFAGASAGIGGGFFVTNANKPCELNGPFHQWDINLPFISINLGVSGNTWIFSATAGPSVGFSATSYSTTTAAGTIP